MHDVYGGRHASADCENAILSGEKGYISGRSSFSTSLMAKIRQMVRAKQSGNDRYRPWYMIARVESLDNCGPERVPKSQ